MMYGNKLACAIKVNGKVLREFKDTVYIPFRSEYSILVKNLEGRRAVVNVYIDGDNAVPGGLVLNANQEVELERKIVNGNLREGNRFKFIERTENIENGPRGIKLEDGLIRIEHQFERPPMQITQLPDWQQKQIWDGIKFGGVSGATGSLYSANMPTTYNVNGVMRGVDFSKGEDTRRISAQATTATLNSMGISSSGEVHDGMATMDCSFNDVGITVPGSKSSQTFQTAYVGQLETDKHTMVIKLMGDLGNNKPVVKAVTVKAKPKCTTCGKHNKATAKFCAECGTALEIFA
jgi:hypothetical protein